MSQQPQSADTEGQQAHAHSRSQSHHERPPQPQPQLQHQQRHRPSNLNDDIHLGLLGSHQIPESSICNKVCVPVLEKLLEHKAPDKCGSGVDAMAFICSKSPQFSAHIARCSMFTAMKTLSVEAHKSRIRRMKEKQTQGQQDEQRKRHELQAEIEHGRKRKGREERHGRENDIPLKRTRHDDGVNKGQNTVGPGPVQQDPPHHNIAISHHQLRGAVHGLQPSPSRSQRLQRRSFPQLQYQRNYYPPPQMLDGASLPPNHPYAMQQAHQQRMGHPSMHSPYLINPAQQQRIRPPPAMPRMQQQTIDPRLIPTVRSSYNHAARRPHDQTRLQPQTLSLMPVTSVETKSSSFSSQTPSQLLIKDRIQSEEPLDGSSQDPDLLSLSVENTQVPEDIKSHAPLDQVQQWFDLVNNEVEPLSATQQPELQADPTEQPDRADRIEVTANVADEYEAHAEGDLSPRSPFS